VKYLASSANGSATVLSPSILNIGHYTQPHSSDVNKVTKAKAKDMAFKAKAKDLQEKRGQG